MSRLVILNLGGVEFIDSVISSGEESPKDADQGQQEDNARCDRNGDQDDDANREEVCNEQCELV